MDAAAGDVSLYLDRWRAGDGMGLVSLFFKGRGGVWEVLCFVGIVVFCTCLLIFCMYLLMFVLAGISEPQSLYFVSGGGELGVVGVFCSFFLSFVVVSVCIQWKAYTGPNITKNRMNSRSPEKPNKNTIERHRKPDTYYSWFVLVCCSSRVPALLACF